MDGNWTELVWIALFAVFVLCFARMVWMQLAVMRSIVRPLEREDDAGPYLFRVPGKAKRKRLSLFIGAPEHAGLRRRWGASFLWTFLAGLALALWTGLFGGVPLP